MCRCHGYPQFPVLDNSKHKWYRYAITSTWNIIFLRRKQCNNGQNICWFSFRLNHLYMRGKHVICWTFYLDWVVGGIQSNIICNRQYLVKKISNQESFIFYPKINKHGVVWYLKTKCMKQIKDTPVMTAGFHSNHVFWSRIYFIYIYLLIWYDLI